MRLLRVIALLATLTVAVAAAATAGGNAMRASLEGGTSIISPDTSGCPAGFDWFFIVYDAGTGTMTSDAYSGDVTWSGEHCTRILLAATEEHGHSVGKVVGTSTMVTPEGELYLEFHGTFVLNGTPPVAYHTDATTPYTVTGGTGIFAGASGHGRIDVSDDQPGGITLESNGALKLSG